jgi:hypothetical protein
VDIDAVTTRQLVASHEDGSSDGESTTDDRSDQSPHAAQSLRSMPPSDHQDTAYGDRMRRHL